MKKKTVFLFLLFTYAVCMSSCYYHRGFHRHPYHHEIREHGGVHHENHNHEEH